MKENGPWHKRPAPRLQAPHGQTTEKQPRQPTPGFNPGLIVPLLDEEFDNAQEVEQLLGDYNEQAQNIHTHDL